MHDPVLGFALGELVGRLGGELLGDGSVRVHRVASLSSAGPGHISFLSNPRLRRLLDACQASAVIVARKLAGELQGCHSQFILVDDPYVYYARVAQLLHAVPRSVPGIHPSAVVESEVPASVYVGPGAWLGQAVTLGENVSIGAGCRLGQGVSVGSDSLLHPGVTVYPDCRIGQRAIIHSGAVIGADGFGFAREKEGRWVKIPQIGRVIIGDDVEIGANTTIDRGAIDDTVIGDGVIVDNLVQIAHNVQVGRYSAIAGCTGIAGSTQIGERCMFGGASMIIGHLDICDDVVISAGTLISKSIQAPGVYSGGLPQQQHGEWLKNFSRIRHLEDMADRIRALEKRLAELGDKTETGS